jgi:hypothetical protein
LHRCLMTKLVPTITAAALLILTGCAPSSSMPAKPRETPGLNAALTEDTATIEQKVKLAAANKKIDELTADVDTLKMNSQTIEFQLLKQRLEALEAIVYRRGGSSDAAGNAAKGTLPALEETNSSTSRSRVRNPVVVPGTSRPATKKETDAFAKGDK